MTTKILHIGFFFRNNLGDDMFIGAFKELYSFSPIPINYHFECADDVKVWTHEKFRKFDVIVAGGGDIINDYFFNIFMRIKNTILENGFNIPIILIGSGVPHPSFLTSNKLFSVDKIGLRNKNGSRQIQQIFGTENLITTPDFGFMYPYDTLLKNEYGVERMCNKLKKEKSEKIRIGISVAQPVNKYLPEYSVKLSQLCDEILSINDTLEIILIPFNVSETNKYESDLILNELIVKNVKNHMRINNLSKDDVNTVEAAIRHIENLDLMICHRFHSHVFSTCAETPFISLDFSRKVQLFLKENAIPEYAIMNTSIETNDKNEKTLVFDIEKITNSVRDLIKPNSEKYNELCDIIRSNRKKSENFFSIDVKKKLCMFLVDKNVVRKKTVEKIHSYVGEGRVRWNEIAKYVYGKYIKGASVEEIAEILCFKATGGTPGSKYTWGTKENLSRVMRTCITEEEITEKISSMVEYIEKEKNKEDMKNDFANFNLSYIEQDSMKGLHRSGWSFCIQGIKSVKESNNGIYIDMYLDKTFGWALPSMKDAHIIPYLGPWCGFLHHTPSSSFGNRSLETVFNEKLFKDSLRNCVGIFCLSDYLAKWVKDRLNKMSEEENILGASSDIVFSVHHPTEFVETTFNINKIKNIIDSSISPHKKTMQLYKDSITSSPVSKTPDICSSEKSISIVNIGAWYRNPISIYRLSCELKSSRFVFLKLKGRGMDNYFPSKNDKITKKCLSSTIPSGSEFMKSLNNLIYKNIVSGELSDSVFDEPRELFEECPSSFSFELLSPAIAEEENVFVKSLHDSVKRLINSVSILQYLPNDQYDELLQTSVVFIDFVDCSAANTIIECLVRNTPMLTNRLDPIVEYFGKDYPLFFDTVEDIINENILTPERILGAYKYIKNLDKSHLKIETFVEKIDRITRKQLSEHF